MDTRLYHIQDILQRSTTILCDHLKPDEILRWLKTCKALSNDEVEFIQQKKTNKGQVDCLLEILRRKPEESYISFMYSLKSLRSDLFEAVSKMDDIFTYDPGKYTHFESNQKDIK